VVEKLCTVFIFTEKKLFNLAQVALTKMPRNEAKINRETDFLSTEGHLLTPLGCRLTLASSITLHTSKGFASQSFCRALFLNFLT